MVSILKMRRAMMRVVFGILRYCEEMHWLLKRPITESEGSSLASIE